VVVISNNNITNSLVRSTYFCAFLRTHESVIVHTHYGQSIRTSLLCNIRNTKNSEKCDIVETLLAFCSVI
jgi:hypothetical protein